MVDMFRKKPILEYECFIEEYPEIVFPSSRLIPEWYKKIPRWNNKDNEIFSIEKGLSKSLKQCIPFFDSFNIGYTVTLPYDIYVKNINGSPFITWQLGVENPPGWREEPSNKNVIPHGHHSLEYYWNLSLSIRIPKGYSMLITHPLNRHDLPFTTLSGIIDGGLATSPHGKYPFYIKNNFEGIISQGTPIFQIIPFCQKNWNSKKTKGLSSIGKSNDIKSALVISGWYKKTFWTKKHYR